MLKTAIKDWKTKPLGELLDVQNGYAFASEQFSKNGGMPLIRIRDLKGGRETEIRFEGDFDEKFVVKSEDLLIGMDGEFRCYKWKGPDALLNQRVCRLIDFSPEVLPEFVFYGVNPHLKVIEDNTPFVTVRHLSARKVKEIDFAYPSISEQRRIVARIKECMERVEEIEDLQQSVIHEVSLLPTAFRYDLWNEYAKSANIVELGSVTASTKNGLYKPKKFHGQGIILLRMFNINGASLNLDRIERLEVSKKEAIDYRVSNGDIIISRVNSRELVGKSTLVEGLEEAAVHEAMIIRLRVCDSRVDKRFLVWLMNSPQFLHNLRGRAKHAIGQSSINQKDLLSSKLPLPPIEEQRARVKSMANLSPLGAYLLTECNERQAISVGLRESILRKAFAGEL